MGRHGQLAGAAAPILFPQPFTGGQRENVARRSPVRREIGQRSTEHLVLIGLCLWMVFILVCHIMSFFFPPSFLSPFFFFFFFPSASLQALLECTYGPYHPQSPAFFSFAG